MGNWEASCLLGQRPGNGAGSLTYEKATTPGMGEALPKVELTAHSWRAVQLGGLRTSSGRGRPGVGAGTSGSCPNACAGGLHPRCPPLRHGTCGSTRWETGTARTPRSVRNRTCQSVDAARDSRPCTEGGPYLRTGEVAGRPPHRIGRGDAQRVVQSPSHPREGGQLTWSGKGDEPGPRPSPKTHVREVRSRNAVQQNAVGRPLGD